jgi:peroxiredoxin
MAEPSFDYYVADDRGSSVWSVPGPTPPAFALGPGSAYGAVMRNSMRIKTLVLPAVAVAGLVCAGGACGADRGVAVSVGQNAPAFQAKTTAGQPVDFPQDYKGKIVLLDFWATWCPPCRAEVPNLVSAYQRYHSQGFEVLGVSLDQANSAQKLAQFTEQHHMPWPQVYDGKFWDAAVAKKYGIHSIPQPILVDGNTGKILAEGMQVRGSDLAPAIQKALTEVKKVAAR